MSTYVGRPLLQNMKGLRLGGSKGMVQGLSVDVVEFHSSAEIVDIELCVVFKVELALSVHSNAPHQSGVRVNVSDRNVPGQSERGPVREDTFSF